MDWKYEIVVSKMKGILLLSHGNMAKGMLQSASIFFGDNIEQVEALDFQITDDSDLFEEKIGEAIDRLDKGEGVIILTDLFGGTPAHKTTKYVKSGKIDVICGMNFPIFLELLGSRNNDDINLDELMEIGKEGIKKWQIETSNSSDDDFF